MKEEIERILMNQFTRGDVKTATNKLLELFDLFNFRKSTFRKATPKDMVVGKVVYMLGDYGRTHTKIIKKVLKPDGHVKAFYAEDGHKYGIEGLYVYNE